MNKALIVIWAFISVMILWRVSVYFSEGLKDGETNEKRFVVYEKGGSGQVDSIHYFKDTMIIYRSYWVSHDTILMRLMPTNDTIKVPQYNCPVDTMIQPINHVLIREMDAIYSRDFVGEPDSSLTYYPVIIYPKGIPTSMPIDSIIFKDAKIQPWVGKKSKK